MPRLMPTPSQTVGPFFSFGLCTPEAANPHVVAPDTPGALRIGGVVYDGAGAPMNDAMLEIWQADPQGRYGEAGFGGFARCGTDADGRFEFVTVKPGAVRGPDGAQQAPHIAMSVFARGLLKRLVTRIYFPDEAEANANDPILSAIDDPELAATLVAVPEEDGRLRFDVRLQGDRETCFFAI
jgi:protocatechuate 3,4-dioxygenase alpha subunit